MDESTVTKGEFEHPPALADGFDGVTAVFTGQFNHHTRDELTTIVEGNGGRVTTTVSGDTDVLFVGDNAGQRKQKSAEERGVPKLSPTDFWRAVDLCDNLPEKAPDTLVGRTVVFTGSFEHHTRSELTEIVEECNGHVTSAVSGNTDVLVVGNEPGKRKRDDAKEQGVPLLSPSHFWQIVRRTTREES